jgi:hypothetical protein
MTGQEGGHCSIGRMQRLARWVAGAVGGIAAYRLLRRRPRVVLEQSPEPGPAEPDARVEELRAKLAESRFAEPAAETVVEDAPAETAIEEEPESPEERRRRVHDEGRAALDEMKQE